MYVCVRAYVVDIPTSITYLELSSHFDLVSGIHVNYLWPRHQVHHICRDLCQLTVLPGRVGFAGRAGGYHSSLTTCLMKLEVTEVLKKF